MARRLRSFVPPHVGRQDHLVAITAPRGVVVLAREASQQYGGSTDYDDFESSCSHTRFFALFYFVLPLFTSATVGRGSPGVVGYSV